MNAPDWMTPLLKLFFVVSYICLAAYVGLFADSMPKGRVMFLTNMLKVFGCLLMLFGSHPLLAYAVVGIGAAAYSPAKYGILTEPIRLPSTVFSPSFFPRLNSFLPTAGLKGSPLPPLSWAL